MNLGDVARKRLSFFSVLLVGLAIATVPRPGLAAPASVVDAQAENVADSSVPAEEAVEASGGDVSAAAEAYEYLGPEWIKGQPTPGGIGFQDQFSPNGDYALWMHDAVLLPLITIICLLVLALLLWVIVRYNRRANTVPSKTSHNTVIEVIWTLVPVLILVFIAIPSITLLARQYRPAPEDALTIKVTGYQWYWGYTYADNGGFEVISNMLDEEEASARGEPFLLAADNRMVVPVGEPIRLQVTGADVIHSFGVPSLWFKMDAVPGRLNERMFVVEEPGIYYGQCYELCGARHAYMPIAIEAVPRDRFEQWITVQGGTLGKEDEGAALDADLPSQEPESSIEGAPGAGAAPTAPGDPAPAI